jgi:hypothetical protein
MVGLYMYYKYKICVLICVMYAVLVTLFNLK